MLSSLSMLSPHHDSFWLSFLFRSSIVSLLQIKFFNAVTHSFRLFCSLNMSQGVYFQPATHFFWTAGNCNRFSRHCNAARYSHPMTRHWDFFTQNDAEGISTTTKKLPCILPDQKTISLFSLDTFYLYLFIRMLFVLWIVANTCKLWNNISAKFWGFKSELTLPLHKLTQTFESPPHLMKRASPSPPWGSRSGTTAHLQPKQATLHRCKPATQWHGASPTLLEKQRLRESLLHKNIRLLKKKKY